MGKEEIKEVKNNKEANKTATQNGVIISVYVESPKPQSPQRAVIVKKAKPKSASKKPQAARKRGYDRRAQLLAYSRDLRNAGSPQEVQRPRNNLRSTPKCLEQKKWEWLMKPASFCIKSHQTLERTSSRWRYERMPIEKKTEKVDRPVGSTSSTGGKKRKPTRRSNSHFLSKIRCMLKELSCKKDDVGKDPKLMIAKST
ncbi:hypothetical protein FH972_015963 [Carpinus fangiana]|uniref:Uncharacterized protein n=1 Tax=Carpinus fangiana TaxID=176857 RepID=A0A5N6RGE8_9ROSI|nr:hypothetical protein FH972_015963 [Carpinus fangiana]